jgi:hypothetical protein
MIRGHAFDVAEMGLHTLVVRKELISRQAEIATAIYKGFSQAKNLAMQRYKSAWWNRTSGLWSRG